MKKLTPVLLILLLTAYVSVAQAGDRFQNYAEETVRDASCRIFGTAGAGSGTLVAKRDFGEQTVGLVMTCAHVFKHASSDDIREANVTCEFRNDNGEVRKALPLAVDWDNDLAAIAVYVHPDTPTIPVAESHPAGGSQVYLCGYGSDGKYQCFKGSVVGYTSFSWNGGSAKNIPSREGDRFTSSGKNQLYVASAGARKGDSGGGMIDSDGYLTGVFWGGKGDVIVGTYQGTLNRFMNKQLPQNFAWACDRRFQRPSTVDPGTTMPPPVKPIKPPTTTPPTTTPPTTTPPVRPPRPNNDHGEILTRLERIEQKVDGLLEGQDTIAQALMPLQTLPDSVTELKQTIVSVEQSVTQVNGAMAQLQAKVSEATDRETTVTLRVESDRYISPSYVDVSVLWALQQQSGIDHMVLITDTSADHWQRMDGEYQAAKAKFPAITLFDVKSSGVNFKELPQLVIYPVQPGADPVIVKGTDLVSKQLQAIDRGEMPSGFQGG